MENEQSRKTLTNRIADSGEHLDIEDQEIVENMVLLYQLSDKTGMRDLPMSLVMRGVHNGSIYPLEERIRIAIRDMDDLARVADNYMNCNNYDEAVLRSNSEDNVIGPVRDFYRKSIASNGTQ